jgi:predicted nucleic-acid-binding Zn-ribbon protein
MKKLIEKSQNQLIVCDNPECDYTFPYSAESEKTLLVFVNMPCPKCGQTLLTPEDYLLSERLMKTVNWFNRWFSWITLFVPKNHKNATIEVNVHEKVTMKVKKDKE